MSDFKKAQYEIIKIEHGPAAAAAAWLQGREDWDLPDAVATRG
jgi:hypothetical protein